MKKILFLLLIAGSLSFAQEVVRSKKIYASQYGDRTSVTLNNILGNFSTQAVHIVINAGNWNLTNDVTFPATSTIEFETGSSVTIGTGKTLTLNGELLAGDQRIFYGTGTLAGSPQFMYRFTSWGNTNTYNIGQGFLPEITTNNYYENGGIIITTNQVYNATANNGMLVSTGDVAMLMTNAYPDLQTAPPGGVTNIPYSFIYGMHCTSNSTTAITVTAGEGYCSSNYFLMTTNQNHTMTSLTAGGDVSYVYIDNDASTYPNTLVIIDSATEPSKDGVRSGWYNGEDRCIGAIFASNSVLQSYTCDYGSYFYASNMILATGQDPTNAWVTPNTKESSFFLPVNATKALFRAHSDHTGGYSGVAVTTKEIAATALVENPAVYSSGVLHFRNEEDSYLNNWIQLGPSRVLRLWAEDDDEDGTLYLYLFGWELER